MHRYTATLFFHKLRETIWRRLAEATPDLMEGEIKLDESYFGGYRRGTRGRGELSGAVICQSFAIPV